MIEKLRICFDEMVVYKDLRKVTSFHDKSSIFYARLAFKEV